MYVCWVEAVLYHQFIVHLLDDTLPKIMKCTLLNKKNTEIVKFKFFGSAVLLQSHLMGLILVPLNVLIAWIF